jgi:putative pyruvate formate lyase activating enzyme
MPDLKFMDDEISYQQCRAKDYPVRAREAIKEMHRQVGDLVVGPDSIAERGLLLRHLVLPGGLAGTRAAMRFLAREVSPDTYVNIMDQYRPEYRANEYPEISRRITHKEYLEAIQWAKGFHLHRGF